MLEFKQRSFQHLHLQFNPRERSRFEDNQEDPCSCYQAWKSRVEVPVGGDSAVVLKYLNRELIGSGFPP